MNMNCEILTAFASDIHENYSPFFEGGSLSEKTEAIYRLKTKFEQEFFKNEEIAKLFLGKKFLGLDELWQYAKLRESAGIRPEIKFTLAEMLIAKSLGFNLIRRSDRENYPQMAADYDINLRKLMFIENESLTREKDKRYIGDTPKREWVLSMFVPLPGTFNKDLLDQLEAATLILERIESLSRKNRFKKVIEEFHARKSAIRALLDERKTREAAIMISGLQISQIVLKSPVEMAYDHVLYKKRDNIDGMNHWSPTRELRRSEGVFVDMGDDKGSGLKIGTISPMKKFENTGLIIQISIPEDKKK